jgi:hypothetical protein
LEDYSRGGGRWKLKRGSLLKAALTETMPAKISLRESLKAEGNWMEPEQMR